MSDYQRHIAEKRRAKLKPADAAAQWQSDGRFAAQSPRLSIPLTEGEAIKELATAVNDGKTMPWAMIGMRWECARKLLEMLES